MAPGVVPARRPLAVAVGWLATMTIAAVGLSLAARSGWSDAAGGYGFPGFTALFAVSYGSVGAVVLWRRPGNRVSRLLLAVGLLAAVQTLYTEYAVVGLITAPGSLPFAAFAAWLVAWAWVPYVFLAAPLLLSIFPDGRLVSPRWRWALVLSGVAAAGSMVVFAFLAGPLDNFVVIANPFGFIPPDAMDAVAGVFLLGLAGGVVLAAVSLVVRYRRADRERRQQLKWLALASVVLVLVSPLGFSSTKLGELAFIVGLCGIPLATGIAVLRYGLYEIDVIINRAIVYGLLTAILAGVYATAVGVTQQTFRAITGSSSDGAIVISTLLVVTAFTPVKNWLQGLVDRRFREAADPSARLGRFRAELEHRLYPLDQDLTLAAALDLFCRAVDSSGGELRLEVRSGPVVATRGGGPGGDPLHLESSASSAGGGTGTRETLRLALAPPAHRHGLSIRDRDAIVETLDCLVRQLR